MPKSFEREDVIAGEEEVDELDGLKPTKDASSASEDEEKQEKPEKAEPKADSSPEGEGGEQEDKPEPKDGSEKPEEEQVDWEQVAKKERWKRQRKNDELEALREENERLKQGKQPKDQVPTRTGDSDLGGLKKPRKSDPGIDYDDDKYEAALDEYFEKRLETKLSSFERKLEEKNSLSKEMEKRGSYFDRLSEYASSNPDFEKRYVEAGKPSFPEHVDSFLVDSKYGPQIEDALYGDLDTLRSVMRSSETEANRILARVEARISASSERPSNSGAKPKKITSAPRPIADASPAVSSRSKVGLMKGFHFAET